MNGSSHSRRRLSVVAGLAAASFACLGLLAYRRLDSGNQHYLFLVWNLFLAWVPFVCALVLYDRTGRSRRAWTIVMGIAWLLFLPNAPYLVTDFIHVGTKPGMPVWYDALMVGAFAATGLLLGFVSLWLVQGSVRRALAQRLGATRARAWSWGFAAGVLGLASLGVYAGRVWRLNSWDAVVRPRETLQLFAAQATSGEGARAVIAIAAALLVGYAVFCLTGVCRALTDDH